MNPPSPRPGLPDPASKTVPRRRRSSLRLAACLLILGLALTAYLSIHLQTTRDRTLEDQALKEAIAEVDAVDPRWRLEEIEADRATMLEEHNSAKIVLGMMKVVFAKWPSQSPGFVLQDLPPTARLNEQQISTLRHELERFTPAHEQGRKLADFPQGRYPTDNTKDSVSSRVSYDIACQRIADLLRFDAMLRAEEDDLEGAWLSGRAALNAGRSLGDGPNHLALAIRVHCQHVVLRIMGRTLAQGEVSLAALEAAQRLLDDEEAQPLLWYMLRGERARWHEVMLRVERGEASLAQMGILSPGKEKIKPSHAWLLRYMTAMTAAAHLPVHEQPAEMDRLKSMLGQAPPSSLERALLDSLSLAMPFIPIRARLRSAIAGLAAERYRLEHGRWPRGLADLVPQYLTELPTDPYSGEPLQLLRLDDGLVVYSVGRDGVDDGGRLDDGSERKGADFGFRLWDVAHRRQPPRPERAEKLRHPREDLPDDGR